MAETDLKWLDEDFESYGAVQLDSQENHEEPLTLKPAPELPQQLPSKLTIKSSFQVDTDLVLARLKRSLWPFKYSSFFEDTTPDLYSPFWIVTTLILLISAASNVQNSNVYSIVSVSTLFYSLSLIVPGTLYCLLSHSGSQFDFYTLLSLYGYSWTYFIIASICSFLPYWPVRIIAWLLAAAGSIFFLKINLWEEVERFIPGQKFLALADVVVGHLIILLSTNLYFLAN